MERTQVALTLHVHVLHQPFLVVNVWLLACVPVVSHRVSEVVKRQIVDLERVTLRHVESELAGIRDVIELSVVAGCHCLEAIPAEVPIELVQKAHEGQVMRWDLLAVLAGVIVAEGGVEGRLEPLVNVVDADQRLEVVRVVTLVKQLSEGIRGKFWVSCAHLSDFNEFLRVAQLVTEPVVHAFILFLEVLDLGIHQELLPGV